MGGGGIHPVEAGEARLEVPSPPALEMAVEFDPDAIAPRFEDRADPFRGVEWAAVEVHDEADGGVVEVEEGVPT
ncbi:MAG: hypothetical protein D6705_03350 [Deltaproteobacteria bacterium]|nr:MAG: hypothetical protein D6705_03350 [Deltaproteobacteria bacterium]